MPFLSDSLNNQAAIIIQGFLIPKDIPQFLYYQYYLLQLPLINYIKWLVTAIFRFKNSKRNILSVYFYMQDCALRATSDSAHINLINAVLLIRIHFKIICSLSGRICHPHTIVIMCMSHKNAMHLVTMGH